MNVLSGMTLNVNPCCFLLFFPFVATVLGHCGERNSWETWKGVCARCNRSLQPGLGIFCGNFSSERGGWTACRGAWCGTCYVPTKWDQFPMKTLTTEDGDEVIPRLQDKGRCKEGTNIKPLWPYKNILILKPIGVYCAISWLLGLVDFLGLYRV